MRVIEKKNFDEERALYGIDGITVNQCSFDGPADGESAFKEGKNIFVNDSFFNLRYPFWHDNNLKISNCHLTELCRAALWYSKNIEICDSKLHGIKALRECSNISISNCDIISTEFGWFSKNITLSHTKAEGEYLMLRAKNLNFKDFTLNGKYSFQYIKDSHFEDCKLDTKDAFWHAKNVTLKNCIVKGEYLAWYSENICFENCTIIGTQPLCYCKNLKLINCKMLNTDLSFEKSEVEATLTEKIISIKNPISGFIQLPAYDELIMDDESSSCQIITTKA